MFRFEISFAIALMISGRIDCFQGGSFQAILLHVVEDTLGNSLKALKGKTYHTVLHSVDLVYPLLYENKRIKYVGD